MLDLDAMRKRVPVITVAQYLTLHGLPTSLETKNGAWNKASYHSVPKPLSSSGVQPPASLAVIPNDEFDHNLGIMRVDRLPAGYSSITLPRPGSTESKVHKALLEHLNKQNTIGMDVVITYLKASSNEEWSSDSQMVKILQKYGFGVVYTYSGL